MNNSYNFFKYELFAVCTPQDINRTFSFLDPSEWDTANIKTWLKWMTKKFEIKPPPVRSRFPLTGKELVELSKAEFWVCAGSEHGGKTLARYIAWKIHDATGRTIPSLQDNVEPCKQMKKTIVYLSY